MSAEEKDELTADCLVECLRDVMYVSNIVDAGVVRSHDEAVMFSSSTLSIVSRLIEEARDGIVRVSSYERAWYDNLSTATRAGLWTAAVNILHASYREDLR